MSSFRHLTGFPPFLRKPFTLACRRESSSNAKLSSMSRGVHSEKGHVIFTLNPSKFAEKKQQPLSIGNLTAFAPRVVLHKQSSPVIDQDLNYLTTKRGGDVPFPSATNAFLYYSTSPDRPRISGELRLRLASTNDPTSFASGSDLYLENGVPWLRPLFLLPKYYPLLYEKLMEEKLVPDDLDAVLSALPSSRYAYSRSRLLYSLNDPVPVDFGIRQLSFTIVTEQGLETLEINRAFTDTRKKKLPYRGRAWAQFERSKFPQHEGTRTVVLRILKFITPVECVIPSYDGCIPWPKEGQLHQKYYIKTPQPWNINIDDSGLQESLKRAFRLLWDA